MEYHATLGSADSHRCNNKYVATDDYYILTECSPLNE